MLTEVLSFGKTQGTAQKVSGVTPELTTQTSYGDYQLNLDGLENTIFQSGTQVYGVIISTKEGNDYGMRSSGEYLESDRTCMVYRIYFSST